MALTWQSVSPSNPAGILQARNVAGANIAKGLDVIGSSMQEGAKAAKDADTGKLLLMLDNAKSRNERQNILDNTDMDYIDQDVIAKDNQEFDVREQQKELEEHNRMMQEQEATRDINYKAFMQKHTLGEQEARKQRDAATGAYRQTTLQNEAEKARLQAERHTADVLAREKSADRTFQAAVARNKKANEHEEYMRSVTKANFDQKKTEWDEANQLKQDGKELTEKMIPAIDGTNDVTTLLDIKKTLRNKGIERNPAVPSLLKKTNIKLGTLINLSNLFPPRPGVPAPTMNITGTTQDAKNRSHNSNRQRITDKLSVHFPDSNNDDLKLMADTILRKSSPGYAQEMSKLTISSDELNNALDLKLKGELQEYRQSGGGLTLDELQKHRDRINLIEVNKDNATGIENSRKRLNAEYSKVFARTPLTDIISDDSLTDHMKLGSAAFKPDGKTVDKKAVKHRHESNINNIIALIPAIHKNKLNYEELKQKVSNSLTRQPVYSKVLRDANISYGADIIEKQTKINFKWMGIKETIDDDSSIERITDAYAWADRNLEEGRDAELTKLSGRLNKKLEKDTTFLNIDMDSIAYEFVREFNDPKGKVDVNGNVVKIVRFDSGEFEKWKEHTIRDMKEKYKHVTDSAINKTLNAVIVKHPNIVKAKTAYDDELAFEKLYGNQNNLNTIKNKIKDTNFAEEFVKNPAATLSAYDLDVQMTKDIIKDADVDDKTDTFRDSIKFSRHVVDLLKKKWSTMSPLELGERAKRVMFALPPRQEFLGDDYTRDSRGLFTGDWMYSDEQIYEAADK